MTGNLALIKCKRSSKACKDIKNMAGSYWLSEGILIELEPTGGVNVIVPSARQRLQVGIGVVRLLYEVVRHNLQGHGASLNDPGDSSETDAAIDQLMFFGVLTDAPKPYVSSPGKLTLLERGTLQISQTGGCYESELPAGVVAPPRFIPLSPKGSAVFSLPEPEFPSGVNLWETIAARRSRRDGPLRQVSMGQLSALLSCTLRIHTVAEDKFGEISFRPVASGGARHPIDAFIVTNRVDRTPLGIYQYDPLQHVLLPIKAPPHAADTLCELALDTMVNPPRTSPAIVFVFIAVPDRTACKYEQSALVTVMKDVGCLIQQCYLTAQGLGLAGCAVGGSDNGMVETLLNFKDSGRSFVGGFVLW